MKQALSIAVAIGLGGLGWTPLQAEESLRYILKARASEIDPKTKPHPEIGFLFEKDGKPQDVQVASVDTRVKAKGKLVIWMMSHNDRLFERLNSYGLHAIQPHYANRWFSLVCREEPVGEMCRGNVRLEAATG
ncbi:MAG: hypothetical protein AAGH89_00770, partial [Verrucomicrobiota bacterium]